MSLIDVARSVRGRALALRTAGKAAPPIEKEIAKLEKDLAALRAELPGASLAAFQSAPGAGERLEALTGSTSGLERRIATLNAALQAALDLDVQTLAEQRKQQHSAAIGRVRGHLERRDAAATELMGALATAIRAHIEMVDQSRLAAAALPADTEIEGAQLDGQRLSALCAREIFRQAQASGGGLSQFPHQPVGYIMPGSLQPLDQILRDASTIVLEQLSHPVAPDPRQRRLTA